MIIFSWWKTLMLTKMMQVNTTFIKWSWKQIFKKGTQYSYQNYKNYSNNIFRQPLFNEFAKIKAYNETPPLQTYSVVCVKELYWYSASEKLKNVRENNSAIMNKKISKIIRDYTKLRDKFLNRYHKKRFPKSQQKHFCASVLRKKT